MTVLAALVLLGSAQAMPVATLTASPRVQVPGTQVRLADVAQVRGPGAQSAGALVIARLPAGSTHRLLRARLAQLVHRALPVVAVNGAAGADIAISSTASLPKANSHCLEAARALAAGDQILPASARMVECDRGRKAVPVTIDSDRLTAIAATPIRSGDYLGSLNLASAPRIDRGAKLILVSSAGPVTVRRAVVALQPLRAGQRKLFVRTADGTVFSAPVTAELSK